MPRDRACQPLTGSAEAVTAYNLGVERLLRLEGGAVAAVASSIAIDPTFALGHSTLALLGHEFCAPVDIAARLRDARLHARRSTERERSHVEAVDRHLAGDSAPLLAHLATYPRDAVLLAVAVPTIAFAGVTTVPEQAWDLVERCRPAYGDDWWFAGLLAFMRQEQGRFDEAMDLSCRSLTLEPRAGHAAHARAHAHYETADHGAGLAWMDGWIHGPGAGADSLVHFSWHAALHELSVGDLDAVRRRYDAELRPTPAMGCRTLVDTGSLLWRWALTPGSTDVPTVTAVIDAVDPDLLLRPPTAFMALHSAVALCAADDPAGLATLADSCAADADPALATVAAPLARAMRRMTLGDC
ncbi:MAG: pyridine nucleotide-disulfide oxidoreductase, partial [Nocardioidaceae bacterium]|nr:pyridine nucleotide-disulfide oxidoreductase [Nocardioidaceae bacterium]